MDLYTQLCLQTVMPASIKKTVVLQQKTNLLDFLTAISSPGNLPGFLNGTNAQPKARASGAPKISPRASNPAMHGCHQFNRVLIVWRHFGCHRAFNCLIWT
eukprot:GHRR01032636.1.p1 GENE.GHRR01032636.1~~GHRR01032636.1.p1  ORF type:complete len:101 (+),score=6.49 GHRR01032636.1:31-333(+)